MPIRKLVELDGQYGGWLEVDPVKARRVALDFKKWLEKIDPENDFQNIRKKNLPIVEAILNGSMELPIKYFPHQREVGEGELDWCLQELSAFYHVVRGGLDCPPTVIAENGRYFAWTDWEDDCEELR
jgi:hypothetical protein